MHTAKTSDVRRKKSDKSTKDMETPGQRSQRLLTPSSDHGSEDSLVVPSLQASRRQTIESSESETDPMNLQTTEDDEHQVTNNDDHQATKNDEHQTTNNNEHQCVQDSLQDLKSMLQKVCEKVEENEKSLRRFNQGLLLPIDIIIWYVH